MRPDYQCSRCGALRDAPDNPVAGGRYCHRCRSELPPVPRGGGDNSEVVGFVGGAMLGASFGGPVGAIVGGVLGAVLGKNSKGAK